MPTSGPAASKYSQTRRSSRGGRKCTCTSASPGTPSARQKAGTSASSPGGRRVLTRRLNRTTAHARQAAPAGTPAPAPDGDGWAGPRSRQRGAGNQPGFDQGEQSLAGALGRPLVAAAQMHVRPADGIEEQLGGFRRVAAGWCDRPVHVAVPEQAGERLAEVDAGLVCWWASLARGYLPR